MKRLVRNLEYNRNCRGRALTRDLQELGLRKGSRLEPSPSLPDVSMLEMMPLPLEVTFWVGPQNGRLTHGCPLFLLEGVTQDSWGIDLLHAWHLGPLQQFVSLCIHTLLNSGLFAPRARNLDAADVRELSLLAIKAKLFQFYQTLRTDDPSWREKGSEASWVRLALSIV